MTKIFSIGVPEGHPFQFTGRLTTTAAAVKDWRPLEGHPLDSPAVYLSRPPQLKTAFLLNYSAFRKIS